MPQPARSMGWDARGNAGLEPSQDGPARRFAIGELADEFGLTHRTIRHYEDEGLLAPERDGTVRVYGHRDRARLALICRGKRLGFSLAEIKEFLTLYDADEAQLEQMRFMQRIARRRIADLERQLQDVQQTLAELQIIDTQISDHFRKNGITETQTTEDTQP
ncbi:MerR family transcriptional regulator [Azospirillum isscasi]|uniref:MerR family DNA-binding transcriptional regulator n=1 Tax=Azospirillum isscasi TaxID=3053926 RepID=A0ABU0WGA8_9PROT|nr:MerR family DNA-binding transcriptional regulator [Azospirillum isscasi]MDQ2103210.1 MerR family DNA-binding transcriptional regulator [Azospirillum isscasi]